MRPEHKNLVLKTGKSFLLPVKIIFRMLLITPNLPKNNALKQQIRRLRMLYLPQKKNGKRRKKKLNVLMMLIAMPRNMRAGIIFVRLLLKSLLNTSLNGLMELLNQNSRHIAGTSKAGN